MNAFTRLLAALLMICAGCRSPEVATLEERGRAAEEARDAQESPCVVDDLADAPVDALVRLVEEQELSPYLPTDSGDVGFAPERIFGRTSGNYSLVYVLNEDRSAIETRYRGPSGAVSAGLRVVSRTDGDLFRLVAVMPGCDELATLAAWRLDSTGKVQDPHVRLTPVAEVRVADLEPGQLIGDRQWRPLERGDPVGEWR